MLMRKHVLLFEPFASWHDCILPGISQKIIKIVIIDQWVANNLFDHFVAHA